MRAPGFRRNRLEWRLIFSKTRKMAVFLSDARQALAVHRLSVLARISAGFPAIAGKTREQAGVSAAGFTRN